MADALKDGNYVSSLIVESADTPGLIIRVKGDEATGAILVKVVA